MSGSGLGLHDELKERHGFDRGIVRSYRITFGESGGRAAQPTDTVEELLVDLGEETTTSVGTGRSWVIDVERRGPDGELVAVERWSMFGYRSDSLRAQRTRRAESADTQEIVGMLMIDEFLVTTEFVRSNATANGVQVAVHHDTEAARAAGARDVFLDTATQVAMFGERAAALVGHERLLRSIELRMHAPICAGDTVVIMLDGTEVDDRNDRVPPELRMRAVVGDLTASSAVVAFGS
jgi:hypothetical protein